MKNTKKRQFIKRVAAITMAIIIGFSMTACDENSGDHDNDSKDIETNSSNALVGKWCSTQQDANEGTSVDYEFTNDGKLLTGGLDQGFTYTVSGDTLTVKISGQIFGVATFSISGTVLTLSNTCGPIAAIPYYKTSSSNGNGNNNGNSGGNGNSSVHMYIGNSSDKSYKLTLTGNSSFELKVGSKISSGTATQNGNQFQWTLSPQAGAPFTVQLSSAGIVQIAGIITFNDGSYENEPGFLTPTHSGSGMTWTVTFNTNGGTSVDSITVLDNEIIDEIPYSFKSWTPTTAGFYPASQVVTWKEGTKTWNFGTDRVTKNITLRAEWANPNTIITQGTGSIVEKAVVYAQTTSNQYILALSSDVTVSATSSLTAPYAQLYIIGIGLERKISITSEGRIFVVGPELSGGNTTIALTLGNNITLEGNASNNTALVYVQNGATFTMLNGSKITGNTSDGNAYVSNINNHGYGAAGVHVDGATLILAGGIITGNTNNMMGLKDGITKVCSAGGVYAEAGSTVVLQSGSISGNINSAGSADIYSTWSSTIIVDGNTTVGEICLGGNFSSNIFSSNSKIIVMPDFIGTATVNLMGNNASDWVNKTILQGATAAQIQRFTLGYFLTTGTGRPAIPISNTYKFDVTGKLVAN